jgi:hypothetical protein
VKPCFFYNDTWDYYGDNTIAPDFYMWGPEGDIYIPGVGTIFPDDIGYARNANCGDDTVTGMHLSDALAGSSGNDLNKGMGGTTSFMAIPAMIRFAAMTMTTGCMAATRMTWFTAMPAMTGCMAMLAMTG